MLMMNNEGVVMTKTKFYKNAFGVAKQVATCFSPLSLMTDDFIVITLQDGTELNTEVESIFNPAGYLTFSQGGNIFGSLYYDHGADVIRASVFDAGNNEFAVHDIKNVVGSNTRLPLYYNKGQLCFGCDKTYTRHRYADSTVYSDEVCVGDEFGLVCGDGSDVPDDIYLVVNHISTNQFHPCIVFVVSSADPEYDGILLFSSYQGFPTPDDCMISTVDILGKQFEFVNSIYVSVSDEQN
jgi:hypothetical protein